MYDRASFHVLSLVVHLELDSKANTLFDEHLLKDLTENTLASPYLRIKAFSKCICAALQLGNMYNFESENNMCMRAVNAML